MPRRENVQAIANLALIRGMVGRPKSGLMPIRGHSNVQGIGSVGVTPQLKQALFERLESHFGVKLPTSTGLDTFGRDRSRGRRPVEVRALPGRKSVSAPVPMRPSCGPALEKLDLLVYLNTTLNTGHAHGLAAETICCRCWPATKNPSPRRRNRCSTTSA